MQESREEIVALVKERADIVQIIGESVDLKKSGARYLGLCPFHGEKTPSFSVHPGQQFFYCFGCGESGDVFSFMMKYHNLDFPSALKNLADRYSITLPEIEKSPQQQRLEQQRKAMFEVTGKVSEIYQRYLLHSSKARGARNYLAKRGINEKIQQRFGLGYAPAAEVEGWHYLDSRLTEQEKLDAAEAGIVVKKDNGGLYDRFRDRVLFPIYELSGRVCGFGGRIIGDGQPKYLNSPESRIYNKSKLLLGLYQQKDAIRNQNQAIVVEGNFDLISLVCNGCENVVAPLGTAVTREQLRLLKRFAEEVVLLFDGDAAGVKAAIRAVPHFLAEQLSGRVALLPEQHDPDTYIQEFGRTALLDLIEKAAPLPEFVFSQLVEQYGLTLDGKSKIVEELRPLVKASASPLQRSVIISHFASELGLEKNELHTMFERGVKHTPSNVVDVAPSYPKEKVEPLSAAQKRVVNFMVLYPGYYKELEEGGVREFLYGSVGEVLYLQLSALLKKQDEIEPEELLSVLPPGAERELVAALLLEASGQQGLVTEAGEDSGTELQELLEWMRLSNLQKSSIQILEQIEEVQKTDDFERLQELLLKKQAIDRELQGLGN